MERDELEAFQHRFPVLYPDQDERLDILRVLTRDVSVPSRVNLADIAKTTEWWSGAELGCFVERAFRKESGSMDDVFALVRRGVNEARRKERVRELLDFTEVYGTDSEMCADTRNRYTAWLRGSPEARGEQGGTHRGRFHPGLPREYAEAVSGRESVRLPPLELHPFLVEACGRLWSDGHYAEAVRKAAVALEVLVKERAGYHEKTGVQLMSHVFSPENPLLAFNSLADQSDLDEQKGMMMLFQGIVAAFRNPRSHKLVEDSATGAQEAISLMNVLARRLDKTQGRAQRHTLE
jgi:uncharacterized protein (TIGR02391 family)